MAIRWVVFLWLAVATSGCERGDSLATIHGEHLDTAGKVLLVNYWAEWCRPCREEIPELNRFNAATDKVLVVGVNFDQLPANAVTEQAQKMGIEFPLLLADPAARWQQQRPQILPTTFVIGADGLWREALVGPQTEASLAAAVDRARGK